MYCIITYEIIIYQFVQSSKINVPYSYNYLKVLYVLFSDISVNTLLNKSQNDDGARVVTSTINLVSMT